MTEEKRELVRSWLTKALHDLRSAKVLANDEDPLLDTATYHCQQAGEKAVKGFLTFHAIPFEKTHNLRVLVLLAERREKRFGEWRDIAQALTPYVHIFRYPGEIMEPGREEFQTAFDAAQRFCSFVLSKLPREVHPPESARSAGNDESG